VGLLILLRLTGKRSFGELSPFDIVVLMLVGGALAVHSLEGAGPGEIALLGKSGGLHFGDAVIHLPEHGFSLLPEKYCTDARQMRESLRKLLRLDFTLLTFAHGLPIVTRARDQLAQLLA